MTTKTYYKCMLVCVLSCLGLTLQAQTADHVSAEVAWPMTSGTAEQTAVLRPSSAADFVKRTYMTVGSELTVDGTTTTSEGLTQTLFKQNTKNSSSSDDNAVSLMLEPKTGIAFMPTKVSFKAARWVTDKASLDAKWINGDGSVKTLVTGDKPNRDGTDAAVSSYSYDLTGQKASESACGLRINIYNMNSGKQVSLGDIVIEGIFNGTVGQVITYTLSVTVSPEGAGTVKVTPSGSVFESGDVVTLTQTTAEGYRFLGWQDEGGNTLSTSSPYQLTMDGNKVITARYATLEDLMKGDYVVIPAGDVNAFREALKAANKNTSGQRQYIFLPNGVYDYGSYKNPESGATPYGRDTIFVDNLSIIGESTDGVIIQITPTMASVSRTAPIMIRGTGTYLQDITFQNNYSYGGNDGQAAALHDRGHHTIGKNLRLISRQDTYYSHTDYGQLYFEDSEFQGTVDFICGRGDVFFNRCRLLAVNRQPTQGDYKGDTHIAAPYTVVEDYYSPGGHGYIFESCYVDCKAKTWDFGRGWRAWPKAAFLNTTLSADACKRLGNDQTSGKAADNYAIVRAIDYSLRVTTKGVKTSDDSESVARAFDFHEYNTMDEQGNVVSPASNVMTFTAADSKSYETILQPDEIGRFSLRNVFPDWTPDEDCRQVVVTAVKRDGATLSWTVNEPAKAFMILRDGQYVTIVDGTESTYTISSEGVYSVRAANLMGGFGAALAEGQTSGVELPATAAGQSRVLSTSYYTISGSRLSAPRRGVNIIVTTRSDGQTTTRKVVY